MNKVDTLQTLEVFSELPEADLEQLAHIVIEKDVPPGTPLFVEAMKGETLFVVLEGAVQVSRKLSDGTELPLYRAEAGDFLGVFSLFEPGERTVSAKSVEPSKIIIVRRKDLLKLAETSPKAAFQFSFELVRNALGTLQKMTEIHAAEIERLRGPK